MKGPIRLTGIFVVVGWLQIAGCSKPNLPESEQRAVEAIRAAGGRVYKRVQVDPKENFGLSTTLRAVEHPAADDELVIHFDGSAGKTIGDEVLKRVGSLKNVIGVQFKSTNLSNAGLQQLARMKNLVELTLIANRRLTDTGLDHLHGLKNLKKLEIKGRFSKRAVAKLKQALPGCVVE